jgi:hypothetical protein
MPCRSALMAAQLDTLFAPSVTAPEIARHVQSYRNPEGGCRSTPWKLNERQRYLDRLILLPQRP